MTLNEYLEEHNLDYDEVILKDENGNEIASYGYLIQHCTVLEVNGNELTIR